MTDTTATIFESPERAPAPAVARAGTTRLAHRVALAAAAVTVFIVHFRPWQGGLLEDWGAARDWIAQGGFGPVVRGQWPHWVGRPLSVFPMPLGMAISDGGFIGPFLVVALVAVAQLYAAWWAISPLVRSPWVRFGLVAALGLKPWWEAGLILRFINAQVAVLLAVLWLGAIIRFAKGGRTWWLALAVLGAVASLMTYQAPAAALCVGAVAIAMTVGKSWPRRVWAVVATVVAVGVSFVWSLFIAPLISPFAYEAESAGADIELVRSIRTIGGTLLREAPLLVVVGALLAATVLVAFRRRALDAVQTVFLLAAVAISPLTALVFAVSDFWLQDHERVVQPVGLTLWIVSACVAAVLALSVRWQAVAAGVLVAGSIVGAAVAYSTWTRFSVMQQDLINEVKPLRAGVPDTATLVVADPTGEFGGLYTLLPPHLDVALQAVQGNGANVVLCTVDGVTRDEGVVTQNCSDALAFRETTKLGSIDVASPGTTMQVIKTTPLDEEQIFQIGRPDLKVETNANGTWWWIDDQPASFTIDFDANDTFRTVTGQIMAGECAAQHVTITLSAGGTEQVQTLEAEASTAPSFMISLPERVTQATLTIDPGASTVCTTPEDARQRTVALLNPGLGR